MAAERAGWSHSEIDCPQLVDQVTRLLLHSGGHRGNLQLLKLSLSSPLLSLRSMTSLLYVGINKGLVWCQNSCLFFVVVVERILHDLCGSHISIDIQILHNDRLVGDLHIHRLLYADRGLCSQCLHTTAAIRLIEPRH